MSQTVAEIEEMLNDWEQAHPRLTPKTRKPRTGKAAIPAWFARLNAMEDKTDGAESLSGPLAGVVVECKCDVRYRVSAARAAKRCFVCRGWRRAVQ